MKAFSFIEAPLCIGSPSCGSEQAYSALKDDLSRIFGTSARFVPYRGDRHFEEIPDFFLNLKMPKTVLGINRVLSESIKKELCDGRVPVTIGGDHSLAMASINAVLSHFGSDDTAVVYIDGHADINTEITTPTGFIHGMPLSLAMGLCDKALDISDGKNRLSGKNLYILGARSVDDGEYGIISENGVRMYSPCDLLGKMGESILGEVVKQLRGKRVHLSFDVDFINGGDFTSTGYIMPGGYPYDEAYSLIKYLTSEICISSYDFVEYNPTLDKDGSDKKKLLDIISLIKAA